VVTLLEHIVDRRIRVPIRRQPPKLNGPIKNILPRRLVSFGNRRDGHAGTN
jgi:hypothetical protein